MEKVGLPIKTKIAAWWMVIAGGLSVSFGFLLPELHGFFNNTSSFAFALSEINNIANVIIICGLFLFIQGMFILKRKKWALIFSIITLLIGILVPSLFTSVAVGTILGPIVFLFQIFQYPSAYSGPAFILATTFVIFPVPFILLLLDRKNFWKIAT